MIFLAGCETPAEYINVVPDLPEYLRTPVSVPDRQAATLADVGLILTDHVEALGEANDKIVTTDCIWAAAKAGVEPNCEVPE